MLKNKFVYLLFFLSVVFLYSFKLGLVPVHLNQDELMFSLNAKAIAETGADYYGNRLPFYFWHLGSFWATPVIVYLGAIFLKFLPMTEWAIRVGSVFVALISIGLIMLLAQRIFNKKFLTLLAGFLMATTPALFINSRLLLDNVYPIPFVLLWLIFVYRYIETKKITNLFVSGLALGVGAHSYHAAKIMMPIYFVFSSAFLFPEFKKNTKGLAVYAVGFLIPILVFIPWLRAHPDTLLNQVNYIGSLDESVDVKKGIFGVFNLRRAGDFASNYLTYFSPKILFVTGDRSLVHSTGKVGAFLFPIVFLLVFGLLDVIRNKDKLSKLLLFGFLTYPIAPALVNDTQRISRALIVIPFGVLISVYGLRFLLNQKDRIFRYLAYFLFAFSIFQFLIFMKDYFGDYRLRSYSVFNNNVGGALESTFTSVQIRDVDSIYLDKYVPYVDLYFRFYEIKTGINFQNIKSYDFRSEDFSKFDKKSLVVLSPVSVPSGKPTKVVSFEKIETIREPDGNETFFIYYRDK